MSAEQRKIGVLAVCLGNICRSPLAEAVIAKTVAEHGLSDKIHVDSAGTAGYHIGARPDPRTVSTCEKYRVPINHRARQLKEKDFIEFDYILVMDEDNLYDARRIAPKNGKAKLELFGSYGNQGIVEDPYYGGIDGFEKAYKQVSISAGELVKHIKKTHGL